MALLLAIIIGVIVGAVAGYILQDNFDMLVLNMCMGIVGAVVGDVLYFFTGSNDFLLFTVTGALCQAAGALLFVLLFSLLHKAMSRREARETDINPQ